MSEALTFVNLLTALITFGRNTRKANDFTKKSSTTFFFSLEFGKFFQNRHREQLMVNSSEHIKLNRYNRRGVERQELHWNCKGKRNKPLGTLCFRYFIKIPVSFFLMVFLWTGIRSCGC